MHSKIFVIIFIIICRGSDMTKIAKVKFSNHGHKTLRLFDILHVKENVIARNKHGIYQFPHELLNYVRLMVLEN